MTATDTLSALLAAVIESPADDVPRLVYADALDDHAGLVPCPACGGSGTTGGRGGATGNPRCPACDGNGTVSDGRREWAEFIRDGCGVLARHTDCPTRLVDLAAGRPVPLRCGACEYCQARRRCEKFYARHRWVEGANYAACFEPTPFDGPIPTGPGLTLVVRRGFVAAVTCTLSDWCGSPCGRCEGGGSFGPVYSRAVPRIMLTRGGNCPDCHGTGRVNAHGEPLAAAHPLETVTLSDREPFVGVPPRPAADVYGWHVGDPDAAVYSLPPDLHACLPPPPRVATRPGTSSGWWTEDDADRALSAACIAWARRPPA